MEQLDMSYNLNTPYRYYFDCFTVSLVTHSFKQWTDRIIIIKEEHFLKFYSNFIFCVDLFHSMIGNLNIIINQHVISPLLIDNNALAFGYIALEKNNLKPNIFATHAVNNDGFDDNMLNVQQNIYARLALSNKAYFSLISKDGSYLSFAETHKVSALPYYILYIVFFTFLLSEMFEMGCQKQY